MSQKPTNDDVTQEEALSKLDAFYDKHLPMLRKKEEYFNLKARIAESELKEVYSRIKLAELTQKPEQDGKSKSDKK
jgi:hypothetical protein